jgi:hypothetical protein
MHLQRVGFKSESMPMLAHRSGSVPSLRMERLAGVVPCVRKPKRQRYGARQKARSDQGPGPAVDMARTRKT